LLGDHSTIVLFCRNQHSTFNHQFINPHSSTCRLPNQTFLLRNVTYTCQCLTACTEHYLAGNCWDHGQDAANRLSYTRCVVMCLLSNVVFNSRREAIRTQYLRPPHQAITTGWQRTETALGFRIKRLTQGYSCCRWSLRSSISFSSLQGSKTATYKALAYFRLQDWSFLLP
jgi:hypothetical protein